jgi:hypothetical protein
VHDTKKRLLSWAELHENPVMLGKNDWGRPSLMPSLQATLMKNYYCNSMQCPAADQYR